MQGSLIPSNISLKIWFLQIVSFYKSLNKNINKITRHFDHDISVVIIKYKLTSLKKLLTYLNGIPHGQVTKHQRGNEIK